ncbi:RluA family pseudouridine synthase [Candidatus Dependentiae bacterium]|nr:RluA family pseudouridine synthase [Candidatus Dependentiae bacterium]
MFRSALSVTTIAKDSYQSMKPHFLTTTIVCSEPTWVGERVDSFLHARIPEFSRNYFQELIDAGFVLVNDLPLAKNNYRIKLNDTVSVTLRTKVCNTAPAHVEFEVIDEQPDFLVINKPAGLLVHHTATNPEEITLVNGLLYRFPDMQKIEGNERPGIIHRIDKNTSGLLLVARTVQAHNAFTALFQGRNIEKTYLAVVAGRPQASGRIDLPVGRHPTERHKMSTTGIESRQALTFYQVQEQFSTASLLEVRIVTGRTHQVRVHCAAIGHGLLGDEVYGVKHPLIARQALHAWRVKFTYQGKEFSYEAPLPDDIQQLLRGLAGTQLGRNDGKSFDKMG